MVVPVGSAKSLCLGWQKVENPLLWHCTAQQDLKVLFISNHRFRLWQSSCITCVNASYCNLNCKTHALSFSCADYEPTFPNASLCYINKDQICISKCLTCSQMAFHCLDEWSNCLYQWKCTRRRILHNAPPPHPQHDAPIMARTYW